MQYSLNAAKPHFPHPPSACVPLQLRCCSQYTAAAIPSHVPGCHPDLLAGFLFQQALWMDHWLEQAWTKCCGGIHHSDRGFPRPSVICAVPPWKLWHILLGPRLWLVWPEVYHPKKSEEAKNTLNRLKHKKKLHSQTPQIGSIKPLKSHCTAPWVNGVGLSWLIVCSTRYLTAKNCAQNCCTCLVKVPEEL